MPSGTIELNPDPNPPKTEVVHQPAIGPPLNMVSERDKIVVSAQVSRQAFVYGVNSLLGSLRLFVGGLADVQKIACSVQDVN